MANVTWNNGTRSATASVKRMSDTPMNRVRLQGEANQDRTPSLLVKQGQDVLLISGSQLQTASRLAKTTSPSIATGETVAVDGVNGAVLYEDDGFSEIDTQGVVVAVIDTGLDVDAPALAGRIVAPYNVLNGSTNVTDKAGHGTHVAGIIAAATSEDGKVGGVDTHAKIMPIKASENGSFKASDIAKGIRYAVDHGAKVINLSVGGPLWMPYVEDAMKYAESKGVVVVGAMGNNGKNKADYPATYQNVLAVGSSKDGKRSTFSNYGDRLDVTAPGENITSLAPGGKTAVKSGTSMATPYVAGEVALVIAQHPDWTPAQVREQVERAVNATSAAGLGYGEVNLFKAVYGQDLPKLAKVAQPPAPPSLWQRLLAFFHLG